MKFDKILRPILLSLMDKLLINSPEAEAIPPVSLNGVKTGMLKNSLVYKVRDIRILTISGKLNGEDIDTIKSMENLSMLNIADVKIESGRYSYNKSLYMTEEDIIPDYMFSGLLQLSVVILPRSTSKIEELAFYNCPKLTEIHIDKEVPPVCNSYFFAGVTKTCKLFVPKGSYKKYWAAKGWSFFEEIVEN